MREGLTDHFVTVAAAPLRCSRTLWDPRAGFCTNTRAAINLPEAPRTCKPERTSSGNAWQDSCRPAPIRGPAPDALPPPHQRAARGREQRLETASGAARTGRSVPTRKRVGDSLVACSPVGQPAPDSEMSPADGHGSSLAPTTSAVSTWDAGRIGKRRDPRDHRRRSTSGAAGGWPRGRAAKPEVRSGPDPGHGAGCEWPLRAVLLVFAPRKDLSHHGPRPR